MKTLKYLPYLLAISFASCEEAGRVDCEIKIKVTQEDGTAVEAANIAVRYAVGAVANPGGGFPTDKNETTRTTSNALGEAILKYRPTSSPEGLLWISKDNYYTSIYKEHSWKNNGSDLRSFTTEISAILKPIQTPIPMVYHRASGLKLDTLNEEFSYDFEVGEALPPHGVGKFADITVKLTEHKSEAGADGYKADIRFTNPLDGVIQFESQPLDGATGSALVSGHLAPESGYTQVLERIISGGTGRTAADWKYINSLSRIGYYFRVRTKTDEDGKIISANYGKVYGPIEISLAAQKGKPVEAILGKMALRQICLMD